MVGFRWKPGKVQIKTFKNPSYNGMKTVINIGPKQLMVTTVEHVFQFVGSWKKHIDLKGPILTRKWVVNCRHNILSRLICESWIFKPLYWQMSCQIMTTFILPKRKFCQDFLLYNVKAVLHSFLEIIGQLYHKIIAFQQNATQKSNDTMAFHCYLNSKNNSNKVTKNQSQISKLISQYQQFYYTGYFRNLTRYITIFGFYASF